MLSAPPEYRDALRMMAAKWNLQNPSKITSAATIAREIVCEYMDGVQAGVDHNRIGESKK
jgi:hypothetical protein